MSVSAPAVWSEIDHTFSKDASGDLKIARNVDAVKASIANILGTRQGSRCLASDTLIQLVDGTSRNIGDLVGQSVWLYTFNHQTNLIEPALGTIFCSGEKETIQITLDNDQTISCTPDHRFMLRDGSYKEAKDLQSGESLLPLYREVTPDGYELLHQPFKNIWERTHTRVALWKIGIMQSNECVHHKDFNKRNNQPANLVVIDKKVHWRYHAVYGKMFEKLWNDPKYQWWRDAHSAGKHHYDGRNKKHGHLVSAALKVMLSDPKEFKIWSDRCSKTLTETNKQPRMKQFCKERGKKLGTTFWHDSAFEQARINNKLARKQKLQEFYATDAGKQLLLRVGTQVGNQQDLFKFLKHAKLVLATGSELTENTWETYRKTLPPRNGLPSWDTVLRKEYVEKLNHKVKSVVFSKKIQPVYDIAVPKTNNFALASGVFVHNCMLPSFAETYTNFLFDPIDTHLATYLADRVKDVIEKWDDRVRVVSADFKSMADYNTVSMIVVFVIRGNPNVFSMEHNFSGV